MTAITVSCPACRATLKMPNADVAGKKARCPKCAHKFVIALPPQDVVPEDADVPILPLAPKVGKSARWIPDGADSAAVDSAPMAAAESPLAFPGINPGTETNGTAGLPEFQSFPDLSVAVTDTASVASAASRGSGRAASGRSGRKRRSNRAAWISMAVTAVVVIGVGVFLLLNDGGSAEKNSRQPTGENLAWKKEQAEQSASNSSAEQLSPTQGQPIPLTHIPFTPHVLCHLRPSELWAKNQTMGEFQALLGDLGIWLADQIRNRTRFEPQDISELTIAINFGARMAAPDTAMVVRLRERQTSSELMKKFRGRLRPDPNIEIFEADDAAFLLIDDQTFVVAPLDMAEDLPDYRRGEAMASPDMEPLIQESDRERHLSLFFDLNIVDSHREDAFMPQLQPAADKVLFWFGDQIETVSWSFHLEPSFYMETLLRNTSASTAQRVQRSMQVQLDRLAEQVLGMIRRMQPATEGSRQMIGRFPAMLQALNVGTTAHVGPGFARLVTILPRQAAANLAAGTLLTWNQSLVTNFEDAAITSAEESAVPDRVADRLKMSVLIDFRRTPLQEAFGFIGESIRTDVAIDGDALKGAGFTQNMPQTMDLGTVTALAAIDRILENYAKERDPLVLIVDEQQKKLILSTKTKAEADGLQPFDTKAK
ncbi:MAG: hypothetical protein RLZZ232_2639 [Planctomycetota bacterium]|jgi:hypothetical protein